MNNKGRSSDMSNPQDASSASPQRTCLPTRSGSQSVPGTDVQHQKKACDVCRSRKVKCLVLDNQTECEGCRDLNVLCTRNKPRRRRGRPSRHVTEQVNAVPYASVSALRPDAHSPAATTISQPASSPREHSGMSHSLGAQSLDSVLLRLGPKPLIHRVLQDWFKIVHPIAPILHRQRLFQRLRDHGSESNSVFAGLVISTCAVTVSTLRRQSFEHYPGITVDLCISIIEDGHLLRPQPITVDWCIAWYHVASALIVTEGMDDYRSYRAIREAMTSVNWLLGYRSKDLCFQDEEILKRLYWLLYMWQVGAEVRGQKHLTFLPTNPESEQLRPKDITDRELYPDLISTPNNPQWPEDDVHFVAGLNGLVDTFLVWASVQVDTTHFEPQETLRRAVSRIQSIQDSLPRMLRWVGPLTRLPRGEWGHQVQMVNILITALWLKSNFLQHLGSLLSALTHQDIASDVVEILDLLPQLIFEANGYPVVYKVRDIGAAYLAEVDMKTGGFRDDQGQRELVQRLLRHLENLDFRPNLA